MLSDVVIDTNVLVHSINSGVSYYEDSKRLVEKMLLAETSLCFDEGVDCTEADNKSAVYSEYLDKLRVPGTLPRILLETCLRSGRFAEVSAPEKSIRDKIREQLGSERRDRTFLGVAHGSRERTLVSHDRLMSKRRRAEISKELAVNVVVAGACCELLTS